MSWRTRRVGSDTSARLSRTRSCNELICPPRGVSNSIVPRVPAVAGNPAGGAFSMNDVCPSKVREIVAGLPICAPVSSRMITGTCCACAARLATATPVVSGAVLSKARKICSYYGSPAAPPRSKRCFGLEKIPNPLTLRRQPQPWMLLPFWFDLGAVSSFSPVSAVGNALRLRRERLQS